MDQTSLFPQVQKIDFEVSWNVNVLNKLNVGEASAADSTALSTLLCNQQWAHNSLPAGVSYTETVNFDDSLIVGYSMDNVAIFNSLSSANADNLFATSATMDECLLSTTSDGVMKYQTLSGCLKNQASQTQVPPLCKDAEGDAC